MTLIKLGSILFVGILLFGCSYKNVSDYMGYQNNHDVIQIVSQESQKALIAQQSLTKYKQKYNQMIAISQANFELDKILIDYIGKPEPLLNSIAIKYGYRFLEFGHKTNMPTVNFTKYHTTPSDALVAINAQLGELASITLDKEQKVITISYH